MRIRSASLSLTLLLLLGPPARSAEATAFVSGASPGTVWTTGYGGTFSTSWFRVIALEAEVARQPGQNLDTSMTAFSASAMLAPQIGRFIPYAGVGTGVYRQNVGTETDWGVLKAQVLGAKIRFGGFFVLRGEYRILKLQTSAPLALNHRISAGAGLSF
jgi:hypothetical protein